MPYLKFQKGFTLVELVVVIAIIGVLSAIGLRIFFNALRDNRDRLRTRDISSYRTALELYRHNNRSYPATTPGLSQLLTPNPSPYVDSLPNDPNNIPYTYVAYPAGCSTSLHTCSSYVLCSQEEGSQDYKPSKLCTTPTPPLTNTSCNGKLCKIGISSEDN